MNTSNAVNKTDNSSHFDVIIVGAGVGGIYALCRIKQLGLAVHLFEAGAEAGGTWYWNSYPGARVDVPSFEYSYSFDKCLEQEWNWHERYSAQPELLKYMQHVVERYRLARFIDFNASVKSACYDEKAFLWRVEADSGHMAFSRYVIFATGPLSKPIIPEIKGADSFKGKSVHTGRWAVDGVDVSGKRVAVIGTGSSGAQIAPELAKAADRLYLFQRTAAYSVPSQNRRLTDDEIIRLKSNYSDLRERARANRSCLAIDVGEQSALSVNEGKRKEIYEMRWQQGGLGFTAAFNDLYSNVAANQTAAEFVRGKIREIVKNPLVADKLMPDTLIGCKRLCVDNGYFHMFNRGNVELISLRENPIETITENSIICAHGEIPVDVIVYATGFDAMSGPLLAIDIRGRDAAMLRQSWSDGPVTYLGMMVKGFPNLFIINGPGSPAGLANMFTLAEDNVDWVVCCLEYMKSNGLKSIEPAEQAQHDWSNIVNTMAADSIYPLADSWYVGANVPGKPRMFMSHMDYPKYIEQCRESAESGYSKFDLTK